MVETTEFYKAQSSFDNRDTSYYTWPAQNVENDLIFQGGLNRSYLRLKNERFHDYLEVHLGSHRGNKFSMRWEHKNFLLVTLENEDPELINAFSKVLGQKPFVRYNFDGDKQPITFEWDSIDHQERYEKLEEDKRRLELKKLNKN